MSAKPVTIAGKTFPRKKDATEAIRAMVNGADLESPFAEPEHSFCLSLLTKHPHAAEKAGVGVDAFFVRENKIHGRTTRGLWARRKDGSEIDFSWVECLTPSTHRQRVLNAMRAAVQKDVYDAKCSIFVVSNTCNCWLTGKPISFADAEIHHHDPTFLELADKFVECKSGYESIVVDVGKFAAQFGDFIVDDDLRAEWVEFHQIHATMDVVDRCAHRREKRGKGRKPPSQKASEPERANVQEQPRRTTRRPDIVNRKPPSQSVCWYDIEDEKERYAAYLCSREWGERKQRVHRRAGDKCERCKINQIDCVHHLTYIRKYHERLSDLAGQCNYCHKFTHGLSDYDPADTPIEATSQLNVDAATFDQLTEQEQLAALKLTIQAQRVGHGLSPNGKYLR